VRTISRAAVKVEGVAASLIYLELVQIPTEFRLWGARVLYIHPFVDRCLLWEFHVYVSSPS